MSDVAHTGRDSSNLRADLGALRADARGDAAEMKPDIRAICDSIARLTVDTAELKGRIFQLPNTVQVLGFILAVLAISGIVRVFAP